MDDFSNASFPPETIDLMKTAMDAAVAIDVAGAGQFRARAIDRGDHLAHRRAWRARSRRAAKNGPSGASDQASGLMGRLRGQRSWKRKLVNFRPRFPSAEPAKPLGKSCLERDHGSPDLRGFDPIPVPASSTHSPMRRPVSTAACCG